VERIKEELGLEAALPISAAVDAALESLGMARSGTLATQIDALNSQLGLDMRTMRGGDPPSDPPQDDAFQLRAPPCKPMPPIGPSSHGTLDDVTLRRPGRCDVTLGELCRRLENRLQAFGDLSKVEANPEELAAPERTAITNS